MVTKESALTILDIRDRAAFNPHFSRKARLRIAETLPDKDLSPFIHPQLHRTVCCAFKPLNNHFSQ
ncbi:hypothetical protein, partial [Coleofasciculus sp. E2-BRE-01]|uniref:hypothetical protein n=1 Tax=Coleofasciculus sp. E2-BRE-01 TaxID=3069524 RepID=UPI003302CB3B